MYITCTQKYTDIYIKAQTNTNSRKINSHSHTHTHTRTSALSQTQAHTHIHTQLLSRFHIHTHTHTHVQTHTHTHPCTPIHTDTDTDTHASLSCFRSRVRSLNYTAPPRVAPALLLALLKHRLKSAPTTTDCPLITLPQPPTFQLSSSSIRAPAHASKPFASV